MDKFDVIVIGGGPGGYLAAERAGHAGLKTAVIEKRALGGVCLNEGCVPSKTFLNSAKIYEHALDGKVFGVTAENVKIDQNVVVDRKNKVVAQLVGGVGMQMKANHVTVLNGVGKILSKTPDGFVVSVDGKDEYLASKLIISSGSTAFVPNIKGAKESLESGFAMTNREILDLREIPKKLVVIGGGVIGLEMASYFNSVGSDVTVIEALNKIAGPTDSEISNILLKNYQKKGVDFRLSCSVTEIADGKVVYTENGESKSVEADKVLIAIGRRAFTADLGLENIGVYTERGAIVTDENMRTNVAGVYATGDVNGKIMLAHTAYRESEVAVNHILGKKDKMRYEAIPSVIYTTPEVGSVGETEDSAKAKGLDFKVATVSMRFSGRYVAEVENGDGICKLIIDNKYNRLIGVHLIGSYASEIIYGAAMMIESEFKIDDIKEFVFPHPTVCEVIREALFTI
ncbi:MAG: dihydrolipoyl dehydrogenase [Oscillospiraceae bacterium]|nr:dihydrolipoyl dehydrogenase [Oscillospiraceae bacterium]